MATAIVGGGIAGLAAAYHLTQRGERVIVFEPAALGGMIKSKCHAGFTLEQGPNVLVERPDIVQLLTELGLSLDVVYPSVEPYGQYVWHRGLAQKVPTGVAELLRSPLFPLWTKVALLSRVVRPGLLKPAAEDLSVLSFLVPLLGERATRAVVDPVLKGIYGGDVTDLSARSLFPRLWDAAVSGGSILEYLRNRPRSGKPRIFVLRGGIQRLTDRLFEFLTGKVEIRPEAVTSVQQAGGMFKITTSTGAAVQVDQCLVSTAGARTASLLEHIDPQTAEVLQRIQFAGLTVVHIGVKRDCALIARAFGVLCSGGMPEHFLGVMFNSQLFPHVAPPDRHLLTVMLGGAQALDSLPDETRLKTKLPSLLAEMFGIQDAEWLDSYTWQGAIPQLKVGHFKVVEQLDACERRHPGLAFIGVDRGGVGVSDRLRIAREGVEKVSRAVQSNVA